MLNKKQKITKIHGFTLVELIIVIVILAILWTIAFMSFKNYSSNSRDSVRLWDVNSLNKWVELYQIKSWYYPQPEWNIYTWTINWVDLVYKWEIRDWLSRLTTINKTPKDPLSWSNYVYWTTYDKKYFQIWLVLENALNKAIYNGLYDWVYAATSATTNYFSRIKGNYVWIIKFSTWTTNKYYYVANIPSLIYNSTWVVNLLNTWTYYVVNDNTNLPYQIDTNSNLNNKTADIIIKDVTNISTATLTWVDITTIVNWVNTVSWVFNTWVLEQLGYSLSDIVTTINQTQVAQTQTNPYADWSPFLAWGETTIHTESWCVAAWWVVKAAGSINLCNFVPWVGWHTCTTLNCIYDADTSAHRVAWNCPSWWSRYKNWWSYNMCRLVDWSWDRVNGNRARAYLQYPQAAGSYCMWWPYGMPTVYSLWWDNLAPALQWRSNLKWWSDSFTVTVWYDRYLWNTWIYWWASTWDWQWQVKTYSSMDSIWCY